MWVFYAESISLSIIFYKCGGVIIFDSSKVCRPFVNLLISLFIVIIGIYIICTL